MKNMETSMNSTMKNMETSLNTKMKNMETSMNTKMDDMKKELQESINKIQAPVVDQNIINQVQLYGEILESISAELVRQLERGHRETTV